MKYYALKKPSASKKIWLRIINVSGIEHVLALELLYLHYYVLASS